MVDMKRYLDKSAEQTDSSMMSHKQMSGIAIQIFLKQQMGDPNDENAPKSNAIPFAKNTDLNLGPIKNKVYISSGGFKLVFQ